MRAAISLTSSRTDSVLLLMAKAFDDISSIVAVSSSVSAERSDTLLFEVMTLSLTSDTTSSILWELLVIILKIFWSLPMKTLMPCPTAATSRFERMDTRLVRSPCLSSMSDMISVISCSVRVSGLITNLNTLTSANARARMLTIIVPTLVAMATA